MRGSSFLRRYSRYRLYVPDAVSATGNPLLDQQVRYAHLPRPRALGPTMRTWGTFSSIATGASSSPGCTICVELLAGQVTQLERGLAQAAVLDVRRVGDLGRLVVADLRASSAVTSISEFLTY